MVIEPHEQWQEPRTLDQVRDMFPREQQVRHLNPELSDWNGVVTPAPRGRNRGQHIKVHAGVPSIDVYVTWTVGTTGHPNSKPVTGWYGAQALTRA